MCDWRMMPIILFDRYGKAIFNHFDDLNQKEQNFR